MIIGIISDTHGLLRESVISHLENWDLIIHAGDIGKIDVIHRLEQISKVIYVKGNCDRATDLSCIPESEILEILGLKIYITHDIKKLNLEKENLNVDLIIYGHSHKREVKEIDNILYINPGSVGPRRFKLPITMIKLHLFDNNINEENIELIELID